MSDEYDVAIVGMGPAGATAAIELAELGVNVALIDENTEPGGQIYRQLPSEFTITDSRSFGVNYKNAKMLVNKIKANTERIKIFSDTYVWGFFKDDTLALIQNGNIFKITYKKLLLSEGAMERSIPFSGWTLPGIMTLGGLQKLIVHDRLLPGRRILLAGCSPLLYPVASRLIKAGAEIVAICDAIRPISYLNMLPNLIRNRQLAKETLSDLYTIFRKAVPIYRPFSVKAASGDKRVEKVTIAKLDKKWRPIPNSEKIFQVDIVGISYGFLPLARLARLCGCAHAYDSIQKSWKPKTDKYMRTNLSNIYIAGDASGIGGADMSRVEGQIAAAHIAGELSQLSVREIKKRIDSYDKERERIQAWVLKINETFFIRPGIYEIMKKDTTVCRCENVTGAALMKQV